MEYQVRSALATQEMVTCLDRVQINDDGAFVGEQSHMNISGQESCSIVTLFLEGLWQALFPGWTTECRRCW